jgi:hypothetical protein
MDLNPDTNSKAAGFLWLAMWQAGPDPIDLPNKMI